MSASTISSVSSSDRRVVSKKRKGTSRTATSEEERDSHQAAAKVIERRKEAPQEPKRKRRSQNSAAVVHQDRQGSNTGDVTVLDDDRSREEEETRKQETLRPVPTVHYHHRLCPLNPATHNRGGSRSNITDNGRAVLTAMSPSSSEQQQMQQQPERQQPPISFHYPQRVRVRRPMQMQIVETTAAPVLSSGKARTTAQVNGKNLLFREEDTENQVPVWQD